MTAISFRSMAAYRRSVAGDRRATGPCTLTEAADAEVLGSDGYQVEPARDGHEAMALAQSKAPALIVMDLRMPGMDGWQAIDLLKADARTKEIPILVVTADVLANSRERAEAAGAAGFLEKPCWPDELSARITAMLGR